MTPISDKLRRSLNLIDQGKMEEPSSPLPKSLLSQLENVTIDENKPLEPRIELETPSKSSKTQIDPKKNLQIKLEDFLGNSLGAEVEQIAVKAKNLEISTPSKKSVPLDKFPSVKKATPQVKISSSQEKSKVQTPAANKTKESKDQGSVIMLQTVRATPKKQLEHDTSFILSPVRRSARLVKETESSKKVDGRRLDLMLEKSNFTYAPNPALKPIQE
jgi:hypothetical protein